MNAKQTKLYLKSSNIAEALNAIFFFPVYLSGIWFDSDIMLV